MKPAILITFFLLSTVSSFAAIFSSEEIYLATKEACQLVPAKILEKSNLSLRERHKVYYSSANFTKLLTMVWDSSFKASAFYPYNLTNPVDLTLSISKEEKFKKAIDECYPDSQASKNFFLNIPLNIDLAAKKSGALAILASFTAGQSAVSFALGRLATLSQLAAKTIDLSLKSMTAMLGLGLLHADSQNENQNKIKINFTENANPNSLNKMIDETTFKNSLAFILQANQNELANTLSLLQVEIKGENKIAKIELLQNRIKSLKTLITDIQNKMNE